MDYLTGIIRIKIVAGDWSQSKSDLGLCFEGSCLHCKNDGKAKSLSYRLKTNNVPLCTIYCKTILRMNWPFYSITDVFLNDQMSVMRNLAATRLSLTVHGTARSLLARSRPLLHPELLSLY